MGKQSQLENVAIGKRTSLELMNDYMRGDQTTEYSAEHKDAISDGDAKGKGVGVAPGRNKGIPYSLRSDAGGSSVDIAKRNELMNMNTYNENEEYGPESVDTSKNIADGQYFFTIK